MTTINTDIYNALATGVLAAVTSMRIAWENEVVQPDGVDPYCRFSILTQPTEPASMGLEGFNYHYGTVLLTLHYPLGGGVGEALAMVDTIASSLKRGVTLTSGSAEVRIESVWRPPPAFDKTWAKFPLQIRWRCHAGN